VSDPKYAAFTALDPFFEISQQGLAGLVDGDHYFDTIADDAVFEFRYIFPGWPQTLNGREALIQATRNGSLRGEELEDLPHHALRLIGLEEKLGVRRAI